MIEAKVYQPLIAQALAGGLLGAVYGVLHSFDLLTLDPGQIKALLVLWGILLPVIGGIVGYQAPHTARLDLAPAAPEPLPAVALTPAGSVPLRKPRGTPGGGQFDRPTRDSGN